MRDPIVAEANHDRAEHSRQFIYFNQLTELAAGGTGTEANWQLMHPYCNQSVKNTLFQSNSK